MPLVLACRGHEPVAWPPCLGLGVSLTPAGPNARGERRATGHRLPRATNRRLWPVRCRVEPVVTHPAPPQTRTCAIDASGSSRRAAAALPRSTGVLLSGLVSSKSLPCLLPADALPGGRLPSRGSRGPWFPTFVGTMRRYDCPPAHLGTLHLSLAPRYLACSLGLWYPSRARDLGGAPRTTPGPLVTRSPTPGSVTRRQVALPSSRATPVDACPALRPRWCPQCSPKRTQDCCLPVTGNRRLSPLYNLEGYPLVHDYTHFGAQSRGLPPRSLQLRTSIAGCARGVCS